MTEDANKIGLHCKPDTAQHCLVRHWINSKAESIVEKKNDRLKRRTRCLNKKMFRKLGPELSRPVVGLCRRNKMTYGIQVFPLLFLSKWRGRIITLITRPRMCNHYSPGLQTKIKSKSWLAYLAIKNVSVTVINKNLLSHRLRRYPSFKFYSASFSFLSLSFLCSSRAQQACEMTNDAQQCLLCLDGDV